MSAATRRRRRRHRRLVVASAWTAVAAAGGSLRPTPAFAHLLGGGAPSAVAHGGGRLIILLHVLGASVWLALAARAAVDRRRGRSMGTIANWAGGIGAATTLSTGAIALLDHGATALRASEFVRLASAKALMVVLVLVVSGWSLRRRPPMATVAKPALLGVVFLLGVALASVDVVAPPLPSCDAGLGRLAAAPSPAAVSAQERRSWCQSSADELVDADEAGEQVAHVLAARGARRLTVLEDASDRGAAFAGGVRRGAHDVGTTVEPASTSDGEAILVLALDSSDAVIASELPVAPAAIVLPSWLLDGPTVEHLADRSTVLAALPVDPGGPIGRRYRDELADVAPGVHASGAGLAAYVSATGGPQQPVLAALSHVGVLPAVLEASGHRPSGSGWLPGYALVTVAR